MQVPEKRSIFSNQGGPILSRAALILILLSIFGGIFALNTQYVTGGPIKPLFLPTPTSTRIPASFIQESQAHLMAGNLQEAINALELALKIDPDNVPVLIELARIQTYYSAILTSEDSRVILQEALVNINRAVVLDEFNSDAFAVQAFVLDWNASVSETLEEREFYLVQAQSAAINAVFLDAENVLASAYRAEVLADQGDYTQAFQQIEIAVNADPNLMDVHRISAIINESTGNYGRAIEEYKLAAEIMPNYTYLYIRIGVGYRQLRLYDQALDYFDRAASINEVLKLKDPLPFVAIAKTYVRQGEFFIAARNMQKALDFDNTNPQLYGELGVIYFQSRNYEGSIPVLKCAVEGCVAEENEEQEIDVTGLDLKNTTVIFYYTYGSVLAALEECDKAVEILNRVEEQYSSDEIIMGIVQAGLEICEAD